MKGQHLTETEFIKNTEEKTTVIAGILYLDFETYPKAVNEVPPPPTSTPTPDDSYPEEKSFEPMEIYTLIFSTLMNSPTKQLIFKLSTGVKFNIRI